MQQPTVTLQNYSGGTLNVVHKMMVQLSKEDKHPQALVYIQEGAPVDLLLGTDVLLLSVSVMQAGVTCTSFLTTQLESDNWRKRHREITLTDNM